MGNLSALGVGGGGLSFSPLSLSPLLWLKADAGVLKTDGSAAADNDPVATWQDQSGNGNHAIQATTPDMPTFTTGLQNGLPGLAFDGTDDWMFSAIAAGLAQPSTTFIVAKLTGSLAGSYAYYLMDGANFNSRLIHANAGFGRWTEYAGGQLTSSTANIDNNTHLFRAVFDSAASVFGVDGALTTGNVGGGDGGNGMTFGTNSSHNSSFWAGDIYEVITFTGTLSDIQIANVEAYLKNKWGTP